MAHILELLHSNVAVEHVFDWLLTDQISEELGVVLKNHSILSHSFPSLVVGFTKEQTARILAKNHVNPAEKANVKNEPRVPSAEIQRSPITKSVETRKIRKKTDPPIDLHNEQIFPPLQSTTRKQPKEDQKKRRINPTQLSALPDSMTSSHKVGGFSQPFQAKVVPRNPFHQAQEQVQHKSLEHERELLKECKMQFKPPPLENEIPNLPLSRTWICIEPELSSVRETRVLDRLSALYSFCISKHLTTGFFSEVKFLLELLLLRISPSCHSPGSELLDSVHQCVYFAAHALNQLDWWQNLDPSTLHLLAENPRLSKFCPEFSTRISTRLSMVTAELSNRKLSHSRPTIGNVSFQSETDNRSNFASDTSFHVFRKQRDIFCEVWQIWKQNCYSADWNMFVLQKKIQSLVDLRRDCVNYVHLARLFRSQLLNVARLIDDVEENSGPVGLLQNSDPLKLQKLRERLVNPPEGRGKESAISFEGDQEFFRDFILVANSSAFNEHLKNCLVNGIEEFSRNIISREDCDGSQLGEMVVSLRILAKFLALVTFRPHESADHLPENIFHELTQLRNNQKSPIDLMQHLDEAYRNRRLVLTLPWIVTYLSLADPVSMCLPSYHPVLCYLVWIFKTIASSHPAEVHADTVFLVRLLLSWFFEQISFPRSLLGRPIEWLRSEIDAHLIERQMVYSSSDLFLDQWPLVDSRFVYQCCPFLWSWKTLLMHFATDMKWQSAERGQIGHRKITPVSAEDSSPTGRLGRTHQAGKTLQLQLEESFFHNQPSSVKRTVDFVSDRLASNVVRDVRQRVIPRMACRGQETVKAWPPTQPLADGQRVDEQLESLSGQLCQDVRRETFSSLDAVTVTSVLDSTLAVLLPNDVLPQVRQVCAALTVRLTREKVLEWTERHVTHALFKNDLAAEWSKRSVGRSSLANADPILSFSGVTLAEHDLSTWAPSMILDHLRKMIREMIGDAVKLTAADVTDICTRMRDCLERRCDVTPLVFRCLQQLSYDFLFTACVFQPEAVGSDAIASWVDCWRRFYHPDKWNGVQTSSAEVEEAGNLCRASPTIWLIFAPRQLLLLAQSTSPRLSWTQLTSLVIHLLKHRLLIYKEVEEQAIAVVRQNWPQDLLLRFATCLRDIVDWHRHQTSEPKDEDEDPVDSELLSWLSWFCSESDLV